MKALNSILDTISAAFAARTRTPLDVLAPRAAQ
ncbi:hypothetical protein CENDO_02620 [Corynebacterium endometrii]|uniref:Uncharacterized protein n=1 Tax=Corynebacterium endometrii TaxID=2488819 RepID=A0A4P7QDW8_9CORY|nr:hypothetical protein CENDO_02620 [Corynebacterium endometrii]